MHNELLWARMPDEEFTSYWARKGCGSCSNCGQFCDFPNCFPDAVRDRFRSIAAKKAQPKLSSGLTVRDDQRPEKVDGRNGQDSEALF